MCVYLPGAFFMYTGLVVLGLLFVQGCLPETQGLQLEEIENLFNRPLCSCGASSSGHNQVQYIRVKGSNYLLSESDASDVEQTGRISSFRSVLWFADVGRKSNHVALWWLQSNISTNGAPTPVIDSELTFPHAQAILLSIISASYICLSLSWELVCLFSLLHSSCFPSFPHTVIRKGNTGTRLSRYPELG